ncbi:MAG: hypothetical protein SFX73_10610 [Kofleriaceae bacterium]|nr:hypothetical protein [Kofleriaceae bacterium]
MEWDRTGLRNAGLGLLVMLCGWAAWHLYVTYEEVQAVARVYGVELADARRIAAASERLRPLVSDTRLAPVFDRAGRARELAVRGVWRLPAEHLAAWHRLRQRIADRSEVCAAEYWRGGWCVTGAYGPHLAMFTDAELREWFELSARSGFAELNEDEPEVDRVLYARAIEAIEASLPEADREVFRRAIANPNGVNDRAVSAAQRWFADYVASVDAASGVELVRAHLAPRVGVGLTGVAAQ